MIFRFLSYCHKEIFAFLSSPNLCFVTWWILLRLVGAQFHSTVCPRLREHWRRKKKNDFVLSLPFARWKFNKRKRVKLATVATTLMEERNILTQAFAKWWKNKKAKTTMYIIKRARNRATVCVPCSPLLFLFAVIFGVTSMPLSPPPSPPTSSPHCPTHYYFHCFFNIRLTKSISKKK